MWWRSSALFAALLAGLAALALSGCGFQPLYGGTTAGGQRLSEVMAGVDVVPIPGRVGQKLRNELIFTNTGGGAGAPSRYRLEIAIKESVTDQLVQITGDATGQVYQLDATFQLIDPNGKVLLQGKAISRAPYNRFQEIFATVRARDDAENRAARSVSE
jgi:LPS-assembly lipoprotein